jgi:hypothetical protein
MKTEMGRACSTYWGDERLVLWGHVRGGGHLEDPDVGGGGGDNIKMDIQEVGWWGMDRINLAEIRDKGRAFVNTVMNIRAL